MKTIDNFDFFTPMHMHNRSCIPILYSNLLKSYLTFNSFYACVCVCGVLGSCLCECVSFSIFFSDSLLLKFSKRKKISPNRTLFMNCNSYSNSSSHSRSSLITCFFNSNVWLTCLKINFAPEKQLFFLTCFSDA